jgi:hypothetical protein
MTTTAVALVVDVVTGLHLLTSSYIGYPLSGAGRFYGFGNAAFAVLAACTILAVSIHLHRAVRPGEALVAGALVLAVVLLADVAPTMGDDVGGALTLVPVFGLMIWVLGGKRLSWRAVVAAVVLTVGAVAGLAAVDAARAPYQQTHVARFLTGVRAGGGGAFWPTLVRRTSNNVSALGASVWTAIVPLLVLGLIYLIVRSPRWGEIISAGPLRVGAVAAFACGLLGFLANDSGVIVPALIFVFVGPYAVLLALAHEGGGPRWLTPADASGRPAPLTASSP